MRRGLARIPGLRAVIAISLLIMMLGAGTHAATAAAPSVEYSRDGGLTWSASPPSFLFSNTKRFVPGDVETKNLLIRSLRADPTLVQVSLANVSVNDPLFDSASTIEGADASGTGLQATRLDALTRCTSVVPDRVLAQGQIVSVALTLRMSSSLTGRQAQDATGHFDLALAFSDPGPMTAPNGCAVSSVFIPGTGTPPPGQPATSDERTGTAGLAYTGGFLAYHSLIISACALGVGWLFLMISRRRTRSKQRC